MKVRLHIDRVVLDGDLFSPHELPRLSAALQDELRCLQLGGPPARDGVLAGPYEQRSVVHGIARTVRDAVNAALAGRGGSR